MATRTAIAAKDRRTKSEIADKDRAENRRQFKKSHELAEMRANYEGMERASNVVKNISQAAFGKHGMASAMASSENNPEWYKKFGLSGYAVNLPTFYRLGSKLGVQANDWLKHSAFDAVPGIAVINFMPVLPNNYPNLSYPNKTYQHSPINESLTRFTAELRKNNSRVGEYDPSDIGFYWYAVEGLIFDLGRLSKALKFYNTYYAENRYFAKACIKSCGFDVDDFIDHVPEYKARLIKWIDIFNTNVVLPSSLDMLKRAFWLANVVVKEHKANNSQIYHFNNVVELALSEEEEYVAVTPIASEYKYATYVTMVESKISSLFNSVGVVIMTADLRAAFSDSVLMKYPQFNKEDTLNYSESIHDLEQIHNLNTLPVPATTFGDADSDIFVNSSVHSMTRRNIIADNDGYLVQGSLTGSNVLPLGIKLSLPLGIENIRHSTNSNLVQFLNFYDSDYVSDDAILESTRLRSIIGQVTGVQDSYPYTYVINGTEIVTEIILLVADVISDDYNCVYTYTDIDGGIAIDIAPQVAQALADASTFDWFPIITYLGESDDRFMYTFGEIDHAIAISNDNLRIIHEGCAFSLFYVTDFGKGRVA